MFKDWQRIGGVSGLLFFAAVVGSFFTPETPDADDPTAEIVREIADDRSAHMLSVLLSGIATFFFRLFVVALYTRLRAAETERGASILVALAGAGTAVIVLVADGVFHALVEAADQGRDPEAVRALFELDQTLFAGLVWTSAAFYTGVALSSLGTGQPAALAGVERRPAGRPVRRRLLRRLQRVRTRAAGSASCIFVAFLLNVL